nr:aspartate aminotransferase family protein [Polymorphobacter sp.]
MNPVMPVYGRCEVEPVRGEGCYLYDAGGNRWLDFAAGIAVNALGHGHPHLTKTIQDQAGTLMHVSNLYKVPGQQAVAQRLVDLTFADTMFFTNSGAEAIECAVKTCRRFQFVTDHPEKFRIVTFTQAFHGRTMTEIAATDSDKMRGGFEPLPDWFTVLPFDDIDAVRELMAGPLGAQVGGFMVEPIQGEGGVRPASVEFLQALRDLADEHGALLIFDEVQCGVARTGHLFAYQYFGVTPDIMAIAKGIGGGFPVGACLATEHAAQGMVVGTHGSTYGGNPLAMAACGAVLDVVATPEFLDNVRRMGDRLRQAIEQMIPNHDDLFENIRGVGLMLGIKMKSDSRAFVNHARSYGVLTVAAADNVMRVLPPLIIDESHVREFVERISDAARDYAPAKAA